jgi:hypothetical protein
MSLFAPAGKDGNLEPLRAPRECKHEHRMSTIFAGLSLTAQRDCELLSHTGYTRLRSNCHNVWSNHIRIDIMSASGIVTFRARYGLTAASSTGAPFVHTTG